MENKKIKNVCTKISPDLHQDLKFYCLVKKITINDLLENYITNITKEFKTNIER